MGEGLHNVKAIRIKYIDFLRTETFRLDQQISSYMQVTKINK